MSTVPTKFPETIDWVNARITDWAADPAAIGLDATAVAALASALSTAQSGRQGAIDARTASRDATIVYNDAGTDLRAQARQAVATIRAFAKASANPATVYSDASIPPPATPTPAPAPGTPEGFTISLSQGGAVTLAFECAHPAGVNGVTYKVERQDTPQSAWAFLTNAKERRFTDATIPTGSSLLFYRVTAQTSTKDGAAAEFTVRFGAGNQGATIVAQGASGASGAQAA